MQMQLMLVDKGQGKPAFLHTLTNDKVRVVEIAKARLYLRYSLVKNSSVRDLLQGFRTCTKAAVT